MTILETFLGITPMLYVLIILMPLALFGFLSISKTKRVAADPANPASPGDQLKGKKTNAGKEMLSALFLASALAFGAAIVFFVANIVADYKESRGIFAVVMPAATFPPAPDRVAPPGPALPEKEVESDEANPEAASLTDEVAKGKK
ncbi:MAG: hypothetical protein WCX69_03730 [Candidatus Paceibacterota bacterium]